MDRLATDELTALRGLFPALVGSTLPLPGRVELPAGEVLCHEGERADCAWLVVRGRLQVVRRSDEGDRSIRVGAGSLIGESGLLDDGVRNATVLAVRDTVLLVLDRAWLAAVIGADHGALGAIVAAVGRRETVDTNVSVVAMLAGAGVGDVLDALVEATAGLPGVAVVHGPHGIPAEGLSEHLRQLEESHSHVLLVGGGPDDDWTGVVASVADHVVVVHDVARATVSTGMDEVAARAARLTGCRHTVVFVHPATTAVPTGTAGLLAPRPGAAHLHLRRDDDRHLARVARALVGRSVTLVLGGGGARGLAEIGVHEELRRLGVPVDVVVGTSAGAVIAAVIALREDPDAVRASCRAGFTRVADPTIPIAGLLKGERLWRALTEQLGSTTIEDLWLPFACVAANLTTGAAEELRVGPVRDALRASVALPGVFSPFERNGELLVDGGLVDNLPVELGRRVGGAGMCIAVDVAPPNGPSVSAPVPPVLSGVSLLLDRLRGTHRRDLPTLAVTMTQSMLLPAARARAVARDGADLYLHLSLDEFRLLDFNRVDVIADCGAARATPSILTWLEREEQALTSVLDHHPSAAPPRDDIELVRTRPRALIGSLWLAIADLRFRLRRFVVAGVAAACTLMLLLLMTGVVNQLDREPAAAAATIGGTHWVLQDGIENPFESNATFTPELADQVASPGGVGQLLLARLPVTADGETIDAILVGYPPTGPGAPEPESGVAATDPDGVVVSTEVAASIGDQILLGDRPVSVTGRVDDATLFAGMPMVFVPISAARLQLAGGAPLVSVVLTDGAPTSVPPGLRSWTAHEIAEATKGPVERPILTLHIVRVLLGLVAAMIIGAVVYLASLERTRDVAVLRAVGIEGAMLAAGVAAQALAMAMVAAGLAIVLERLLAPTFPLTVHLTVTDLVVLPVTAAVIAMIASYAAIRRTLRIDPADAFAGIGG